MHATMKKWGVWALRSAKWVAVGIAFLAAFVFSCWYFLPDEALLPDAQALRDQKSPTPLEQNAFYPRLGLTASADLNATDVGVQIAKMLEATASDGGSASQEAISALLGSAPFKRRSPPTPYCRNVSETPSCVDAYLSHRAAVDAQWTSAAPFIQRYRALRALPRFEEASSSLWGSFGLGEMFEVAELVDAKIALDMLTPALRTAALGELQQEILFTQGIVRQSDFLVTQQVFAAQLRKKYRLAAELLTRYPDIALTHATTVALITQPLKPEDAHLKRVMDGEFRLAAATERRNRLVFAKEVEQPEATAVGAWWRSTMWRVLYQPNATLNLLYKARMRDGAFYSQSAAAIQSALAKDAKLPRQSAYTLHPLDPRWILYNPMGKTMVYMNDASLFQQYSDRLNDLLAFTRLLELQRQMIVGRIAPDQAATFVAKAGPALDNPYTEQPMQYDAVRHTITFAAKSQRAIETGTDAILLAKK